MKKMKFENKEAFYNAIKNANFGDNSQLELCLDESVIATLTITCNDKVVNLLGKSRGELLFSFEIERQSGECVPIDEILTKFNTIK